MPELSIVIPCLNEAENLPLLLPRLDTICRGAELDVETIILDDASGDETLTVARKLRPRFPSLNIQVFHRYEPRRGYGAVVRYGLAYSIGRYALFVAADGVDPIELIPNYLEQMRAGAQLVQCSRYLNPDDASTIPFKYKFYQTIYRTLIRLLLSQEIRDSTYAFKMFDRAYVMALGVTSNRFSISPEITFKVLLSGGKIVYVPGAQVVRQRGVSKFIFRREGFGYALVLLRAWLHRLGILWF